MSDYFWDALYYVMSYLFLLLFTYLKLHYALLKTQRSSRISMDVHLLLSTEFGILFKQYSSGSGPATTLPSKTTLGHTTVF